MFNLSMLTPKRIGAINEILQAAKGNEVMRRLGEKFVGADAQTAYDHIRNLSDEEKRVLAVMIGQINHKFGR